MPREPLPFIYRGPTDTRRELARYRNCLMAFIEAHVPPPELGYAAITLNCSHLIRFMQDAQQLERTESELQTGLHEAQQAGMEPLIELRAICYALLLARGGKGEEAVFATLLNHLESTEGGKPATPSSPNL